MWVDLMQAMCERICAAKPQLCGATSASIVFDVLCCQQGAALEAHCGTTLTLHGGPNPHPTARRLVANIFIVIFATIAKRRNVIVNVIEFSGPGRSPVRALGRHELRRSAQARCNVRLGGATPEWRNAYCNTAMQRRSGGSAAAGGTAAAGEAARRPQARRPGAQNHLAPSTMMISEC